MDKVDAGEAVEEEGGALQEGVEVLLQASVQLVRAGRGVRGKPRGVGRIERM